MLEVVERCFPERMKASSKIPNDICASCKFAKVPPISRSPEAARAPFDWLMIDDKHATLRRNQSASKNLKGLVLARWPLF